MEIQELYVAEATWLFGNNINTFRFADFDLTTIKSIIRSKYYGASTSIEIVKIFPQYETIYEGLVRDMPWN